MTLSPKGFRNCASASVKEEGKKKQCCEFYLDEDTKKHEASIHLLFDCGKFFSSSFSSSCALLSLPINPPRGVPYNLCRVV